MFYRFKITITLYQEEIKCDQMWTCKLYCNYQLLTNFKVIEKENKTNLYEKKKMQFKDTRILCF